MPRRLDELTWREVERLDRERAVALLAVGAVEAHGPHLPLATDLVIAEAMAQAAAERLERAGHDVVLLPTLPYGAAPFAAGFAGTLSVDPEPVSTLIVGIGRGIARHVACLGLANAHLDPAHLASLRAATESLQGEVPVAFADLTRRSIAERLTAEFRSGACHAGCFETSIVQAARPDLVHETIRRGLQPQPISLSDAIRSGQRSFEEAGLDDAYCGDPSAATLEEGQATIAALGAILTEAVLTAIEARR